MSQVRSSRGVIGKVALALGTAAVAAGLYTPAADAAYRPACVQLLGVAPKSGGVVGRVKFACPPTGASQWRFSLSLTSLPDCDFAALPTAQMGGPFAFGDPWPINRMIETRVAGRVNRVNNWTTCLTVHELNSNLQWKQIAHECVGFTLDTYPGSSPAK